MELRGFPNQSRDYARPGQQKGSVHQRTQAENGSALSQGTLDGDSRLWVQTISADRYTASRGGDMQPVTYRRLPGLHQLFCTICSVPSGSSCNAIFKNGG